MNEGSSGLNVLDLWKSGPRSAGWDAATLRRSADQRLRALVRHAYDHTAFYRREMEARQVRPEAINGVEDLSRLPLVSPQQLRDNTEEWVSDAVDRARCTTRRTSGTSGKPLLLPVTSREVFLESLLWGRGYIACGLRPWHREAKFEKPQFAPPRHRLQGLGLFRRRYFSVAEPTSAKVEWLRKTAPDALFAWATVLDEIALYCQERDIYLTVPYVFSASEMLFPDARARIERHLNCQLTDVYGSVETGPIAWQCPAGKGFHVNSNVVHVEIVDDKGAPAPRGNVVCTAFWRTTVPLIRYNLADIGEWGTAPCGCGNPRPLLAGLHGRISDVVRLPSGEWIPGLNLGQILRGIPGIRQHRILQDGESLFRLQIAVGAEFIPELHEARIRRNAEEWYPGKLEIRLERVPEIPRIPGEKFRVFLSQARQAELRRQGYGGQL